MTNVIPFPVIPDIEKFVSETTQLHNAVITVLSDEEEQEWQKNDGDTQNIFVTAQAMYYSEYNEEAFIVESQNGTKLALGYLDDGVWKYRILNKKEQKQLTSYMEGHGTKVPNIRVLQSDRQLSFQKIEEEISDKGCSIYMASAEDSVFLSDPNNSEGRADQLITEYQRIHFESNKTPFVICNQESEILVVCAFLPQFQIVLYDFVPEKFGKKSKTLHQGQRLPVLRHSLPG
ncbi:MAG: hypothetical protein HQM14_19440 [SAR324 cluster bacterium]|nr:hypothetical protein [SAR324 cluster bacterium]